MLQLIRTLLLACCFMSLLIQATSSSVHNDDLRVQVLNINQVPSAKNVGTLIIKKNRFSKNMLSRCSAVLIAEEYLMTAAHCVFDHLKVSPAMSIEFIPQYLGLGLQRESRVFVQEGWIHKQYLQNDYKDILQFPNGLISLQRETRNSDLAILKVVNEKSQDGLGKLFGYIKPIQESQASTDNSQPVSLLSYPGDKDGSTLWYQECELKKSKHLIGKFDCRVYSGASGAGILTKTSDTGQRLLGIVSTSSRSGYEGEAVLFSDKVIEDIEYIIAKQDEKVTQFDPVTFKTTKKVYIHIENRCNKEIIAQAYHQPSDRDNWVVIEENIPVNSSALFNSVNSRTWYSHIRDLDGRPYNLGKDIALTVGSKKYLFKKRTIPYRNSYGGLFYGDHFLRVHCI